MKKGIKIPNKVVLLIRANAPSYIPSSVCHSLVAEKLNNADTKATIKLATNVSNLNAIQPPNSTQIRQKLSPKRAADVPMKRANDRLSTIKYPTKNTTISKRYLVDFPNIALSFCYPNLPSATLRIASTAIFFLRSTATEIILRSSVIVSYIGDLIQHNYATQSFCQTLFDML